jgi:hypothetical protein
VLRLVLNANFTLTDEAILLGGQPGNPIFDAIVCKGPEVTLPDAWKAHRYEGPPVLFGHYWFSGPPQVIPGQFVSLDYSVAKGGPLVAYRWDGETELRTEKMAWV